MDDPSGLEAVEGAPFAARLSDIGAGVDEMEFTARSLDFPGYTQIIRVCRLYEFDADYVRDPQFTGPIQPSEIAELTAVYGDTFTAFVKNRDRSRGKGLDAVEVILGRVRRGDAMSRVDVIARRTT